VYRDEGERGHAERRQYPAPPATGAKSAPPG